MRKAVLATATCVVIWAVQDIAVWGWFIEDRQWPGADALYQPWHQAFLFLLIVVAVAWVGGGWGVWAGLTTYVLAYGGWADLLYYWIDLRPLPAAMPWLDGYHPLLIHPVTAASLVGSSLLWAAVATTSVVLIKFLAGRLGGSTGYSSRPTPRGLPGA